MDTCAACHHCGEPLPQAPAWVVLDGAERPFCCQGCASAAQWIRDARLDDYYRLRSAPATRVGTELPDMAVWDREDLVAGHAREVEGGREITVLTDAMHCAACAWLVDRALSREPGVREVTANAITGRVRIAWDPAQAPLSRLLSRMAALGYRPYLATGEARERARRRERNRAVIRIGLAGLGAMQAMMFAEALYLDTSGQMPLPTRDFFRWITFLVSTPVVFWAGWPFLAGAWRELRLRRPGMDTLVSGSTLLAYFASVWGTVTGGEHVWYDAAVMFVFLLLVARQLEQRARGIASAQVDALARARPGFATRERADGSRESVPLAMLQVEDVAWVAVGEAVPADGVLLDADASFEEALLTGESSAVHKCAGDDVFAGTACRERPARVRVTRVGADTRLAQLARLVEQAQAHRPALAIGAERIAGWFVVALAIAAIAVYAWWRVHEPARAFEVVLALLVVSCPCALSLAVPSALATAHGALARRGVLAVRPEALERLAQATDVVFDKTGTLGDGQPRLLSVDACAGIDEATARRIAAALERDGSHPLRAAFAGDLHRAPMATNVRAVAGQGVEGEVDGVRWRLGQAAFATGGGDDGALWLASGAGHRARFVVAEGERPDARATVESLRALGLRLHLSSGDGARAVHAFAAGIGITDAHARQSPEAKLAYARGLQAEGRVVAMVGDGLNDAPVLAGADVSLAIGDGTALAQRAADLVVGGSLRQLPAAIAVARRTRRIIRQNLGWALGYNLLALPLAAAGLVTPWLAALGMALSSLLVTGNALRLARA